MKFIQISQSRSGTHMLRGVFMNHPEIPIWYDYMGAIADKPGALPDYLRDAYAKCPSNKHVGAMTHFGGIAVARGDSVWRRSWKRVRSLHDRAIVLTRSNTLHRYLSKRIATQRNSWNCAEPRDADPTIEVTLHQYRKFALQAQQTHKVLMEWVKPYLHITYMDLVNNWEQTLRSVYEYLGLTWNNPRLITHKQETRPVSSIISNYDQLLAQARSARRCDLIETLIKEMQT